VKTVDRRLQLVTALSGHVAGVGAEVLVTDDPRQAIAPCILLHPVPARTYTALDDGLVVTLSWQVIALAPGGQFDAATADVLDGLQELVEDALEGVTRILSARVASFTTRTEQPPQLAIITILED